MRGGRRVGVAPVPWKAGGQASDVLDRGVLAGVTDRDGGGAVRRTRASRSHGCGAAAPGFVRGHEPEDLFAPRTLMVQRPASDAIAFAKMWGSWRRRIQIDCAVAQTPGEVPGRVVPIDAPPGRRNSGGEGTLNSHLPRRRRGVHATGATPTPDTRPATPGALPPPGRRRRPGARPRWRRHPGQAPPGSAWCAHRRQAGEGARRPERRRA